MDCQAYLSPLLGCAGHLAKERMDARLSQYDMTPAQTQVLLYLHRQGGRTSQREVTAHLRVKPSTANGILDRLEEKGLAVRSVSPADARSRLLTLTEKGRQRIEQLNGAFLETEALMKRALSEEELEMLRSLLRRVIHHLEEDRTV